ELPVPDGVIVSSDAYRRFMQPLAGAVSNALEECGDDAGAAAQRVRELVLAAPLPGELAPQLEDVMQARGLLQSRVAVRSSGTLYGGRLGLKHTAAAMAVVVQAMVDVRADDAAGVAFSIDPVRGDLSQVLVNAAFGLGETVVAGESPVDEYRLPREGDAPGEESVAITPQALVADGDGVASVTLDPAHAARSALDAAQRRDVARLALAAEHNFRL